MSSPNKTDHAQDSHITPSIVWFEIPADNIERAKSFYGALFGWKIERFPGPAKHLTDYWHIDTGGGDDTPDGGLLKRQHPQHQGITNYVAVASVDESAAQVQKLGGQIMMPKTPVPQMGYFVLCQDTEKNTFALWEKNENAK